MNELNWTEENGVWRASANGFSYTINPPHPVEQCWFLEISFPCGQSEIVATEYEDFHKGCEEAAQAHANAVQTAVDTALEAITADDSNEPDPITKLKTACAKEREMGDRLAAALRCMDFSFQKVQHAQIAEKAEAALAAHAEARKG